jgi:hypothetical protein
LRGAAGGASAGIALPLLDAMIDGRGRLAVTRRAHAAPSGSPLCLITFSTPCGIHDYRDWYPKETGSGYTLKDWMEPLAAYRNDFTFVSGTPKQEMWLNQNINNDAHIRAQATFATGAGITKTGAGGQSVDQMIAEKVGAETKFKSLPLAIGKVSDPRLSNISWAGVDRPVPADRDPEAIFRRLFGGAVATPGQESNLGKYRKSVLDYVKADIGRVSARVGASDRKRLEAHLGAVRELEQQIAKDKTALASCAVPPMPGMTPALSNERAQLMLRLMTTALSCDLTRVATFMLASRADERVFSWVGATKGHHTVSHLVDPAGIALRKAIWMDELAQLAFLYKTLKEIKEPTGTLFDRSLVFFSNEHGDGYGDTHYCGDMPSFIGGKANGKLRLGLHLRGKGQSYSNIFVSVLQMFGFQVNEFGVYGKAPLDGLAA